MSADRAGLVDEVPLGLHQLTSALRELAAHGTTDDALQLLVDLALELVRGCDAATVTLIGPDGVATAVATDEVAMSIEAAQARHDEGPCLTAAREHLELVRVDDLDADGRWPSFRRDAHTLGVRAMVSFGLSAGRGRGALFGSLNLYARRAGAFDEASLSMGRVLAAQCSTALRAAVEADGLRTALASRDLIGQAKGILMERYRLTGGQAFELLRRTSQDRNIVLREVARRVVETRSLP